MLGKDLIFVEVCYHTYHICMMFVFLYNPK